jgi:hypothetical protein
MQLKITSLNPTKTMPYSIIEHGKGQHHSDDGGIFVSNVSQPTKVN